MSFRMYSIIEFDRPIVANEHYISAGGFTMTMQGKTVDFDFCDYYGTIDKENPCLLETEQRNLDCDTFEEASTITQEMLENIETINEFSIYTGEEGDPVIYPVRIKALSFVIFDAMGKSYQIDVKEDVLKNATF